jgi:uracil-DNA glycosylase family 4
MEPPAPERDCPLCPRLAAFRADNRLADPGGFNAPVPSLGGTDAWLLIVGLAPGRRGANRTGRPFTGDFAGELLFGTLSRLGLTRGHYAARADDGLRLIGCRLTNAVRCVPPGNRPTPAEIANCRPFLAAEILGMPRLRAILALGAIAHGSLLAIYGLTASRQPFRHGARYDVGDGRVLADSYHCSRQNTNTGRLTAEMFEAVLRGLLVFRES